MQHQRLEDPKDVTLSCLLVYAINQKGRNPVMPHCEKWNMKINSYYGRSQLIPYESKRLLVFNA
jgi:hypothetical protein